MIFTYMQNLTNKQMNIYNQTEIVINRTGGYQRSWGGGAGEKQVRGIKKHKPPVAK